MKDGLINIAKKFLLTEAVVKEYTLSDTSTLSDFESETEIIAHLVKDPKIKAATGGSKNLYFDGSELVYKDKTVKGGLIDKDGFSAKVKLGDLKRAILSMPGLQEEHQLEEAASRAAKTPAAVKVLSMIDNLDDAELEDFLYGLEYMIQLTGFKTGNDDYVKAASLLKSAADRFSKRAK